MADGFSIAALGMINDMERMNGISQNLTNALTPGYKRSIPFNTVLSGINATSATPGLGAPAPVASAPVAAMVLDMKQGTLRATGNPLDLAIENSGFFEVQRDGQTYYTRQGNFVIDASARLATQTGDVVSGLSGDLKLTGSQPTIDRKGQILENGKVVGQIKLVQFDDPTLLQAVGEGKYLQGGASLKSDDKIAVRQGHLEASNVNTAAEMVRMIETMRHFETGQKIIQMYDAMNEGVISKLGQF